MAMIKYAIRLPGFVSATNHIDWPVQKRKVRPQNFPPTLTWPAGRALRKPIDWPKVTSDEEPPLSLVEVAHRLGYHLQSLARRYPGICHAISTPYMACLRTCRSECLQPTTRRNSTSSRT